ncbi:MAG TPA: hypothetical protein VHW60_01715 [Caulobacteraceae bacterium]|jgi:hypothetical protein|nr:hypothetical protein [Caulobacteraceae bacterium]
MIRVLVIAAAFAALSACASESGPEGNPWYQIGDANYDTVKAASDACTAKGGTFQLKQNGDPTHMGDYECKPKGAS